MEAGPSLRVWAKAFLKKCHLDCSNDQCAEEGEREQPFQEEETACAKALRQKVVWCLKI